VLLRPAWRQVPVHPRLRLRARGLTHDDFLGRREVLAKIGGHHQARSATICRNFAPVMPSIDHFGAARATSEPANRRTGEPANRRTGGGRAIRSISSTIP
jgi:hypothetical protein